MRIRNIKAIMSGRFLMLLCLTSFFPALVFADIPAPNAEHEVYSQNGQFYIRMTPKPGGEGGYGAGRGIVYRRHKDGHAEELWKVDFFSAQPFLTSDGKHLIVFGPWAASLSDLAIAFYEDGKELKRYTVGDLIPDESKLQKTASHFFWQVVDSSLPIGLSNDQKSFSVALVDGTLCTFEVASGNILSRAEDAGIRG